MLQGAGVGVPQVWPMIRARLVAVNDRPVRVDQYTDERAQRLLDREFNLSYSAQLPAHNRLVAGRWFDSPDAAEVSVESGILKTLGLALGDRLSFDVAGQVIHARIGSVRKLAWDSMQGNFFMIGSPGLAAPAQQQ